MTSTGVIAALLRANVRAGELRDEALGFNDPACLRLGILRGAPTHSVMHLFNALEEDGWTITPVVKDTQKEEFDA